MSSPKESRSAVPFVEERRQRTFNLTTPCFDFQDALVRVDGDELFLRELAELFIQQWSDLPATIEALGTNSLYEVERLAHNLKGAACYFLSAPHGPWRPKESGDGFLPAKTLLPANARTST